MTELLAVGRVARAHGVRGEVAVQILTEVPDRFAPGSVLALEDGRTLTVEWSRPHRDRLLVKFEEVADREGAGEVCDQLLLIPADRAPAISDEDRFWIHQVVGLEVVTEEGSSLGRIREVQANPANDLWVTDRGTLIPAVRELVRDVDLAAGRVTVRDLPGLVEER
jgi:16S rRNA processing protein RimM